MSLLKTIIEISKENSKKHEITNDFNHVDRIEIDENNQAKAYKFNILTCFNIREESEKIITVNKENLFCAQNFKIITKVKLPTDIEEWFINNHYFITLQYPVFSEYTESDYGADWVELLHPERMALTMRNKWNSDHRFYNNQCAYQFLKYKEIPIGYTGDGCYITYYYGGGKGKGEYKKRSKGIYFCDKKIADSYEEFILRLAIKSNYYYDDNFKDIEYMKNLFSKYSYLIKK